MIYFIIFGIVLVFCAILWANINDHKIVKEYGLPFLIFISIILGFFIGIIVYLVSGVILFNTTGNEDIVVVDANIVALEDSYTISGHRCLTSGYIEENLSYTYIHRERDGGMRTYRVPANLSTVYYIEDNEKPHIEYYNKTFKNKTLRKIYDANGRFTYIPSYKIYVPKGSIVEEYNIDLK